MPTENRPTAPGKWGDEMADTVHPDEWLSDKWSHEAIMDMQARLAPDDIKRMAAEWESVLSEIDALFSTFLYDVSATLEEGWSGPGAQAALRTMRSYVGNARTTLGKALTLSTGLNVLASAASELRQNIASPSGPAPAGKSGETLGWGSPFAQDFGLWERALNQVVTVYSGPAVRAGNAVAALTGPQERLRFGSGVDADLSAVVDRSEDQRDEQAQRAEKFLSRWGLGEPNQQPAAFTATPAYPCRYR